MSGSSNGNIAVFTCITDDYDRLRPPAQVEEGVEYFLYTDKPSPVEAPWTAKPLPLETGSRAGNARFVKMHPHLLFPNHSLSVYVDGNVRVLGGLTRLCRSALAHKDIALYRHPFRDCAYAEAAECAAIGHDWAWRIARQMRQYRREGFPEHAGLYECNVILRRHCAATVQRLMEEWWRAYTQGVRRDQLSLPYLLWAIALSVEDLGQSDQRHAHRHFRLEPGHSTLAHAGSSTRRRINRLMAILGFGSP